MDSSSSSSTITLGKSGLFPVQQANRENVAQRVWPRQTPWRKGEQKCRSGRRGSNEEMRHKGLTAERRKASYIKTVR
jgi:hypothetical protein